MTCAAQQPGLHRYPNPIGRGVPVCRGKPGSVRLPEGEIGAGKERGGCQRPVVKMRDPRHRDVAQLDRVHTLIIGR